ncbi:MAG: NAD(P)/FAD-dependent oxidoreductase [Chloroflexi bacterium]|nr:NAD(P)/FAD-dependent oxidoreductase [Chloroflexota bacterium]
MYDIAVIGGGPIGSYTACQLAKAGNRVVVLEQRDRLGEKHCCTGIISRECVSFFALDESIILGQLKGASIFSPSGGCLRLWREETQAYVIDRAAFDNILARKAKDEGAEYILNCEVREIEVGNDKVGLEATCDGVELNLEARVAVIATGFGSRLAEKLGLGRVGDFVIGAQAEVETSGVEEVEIYFGKDIAPGFFAWLVPISSGKARVGLLSRRSAKEYLKKLMSSLIVQGKIMPGEYELSYGGIPLQPLSKTYCDRVIVVGDAAGQVKPTTGGGIYYGLLCADIAAHTLRRAMENNNLSAGKLSSYEREWKRKLGRELKLGYRARKLFERLNDNQIDRIFDIIKNGGLDETLLKSKNISFDWHSEALSELLRYKAVSLALEVVKIPFRLTRS